MHQISSPILRIAALSICLIGTATSQALAEQASRPASRVEGAHVGAMWGGLVSSQLRSEDPTAFWNVHMHLPVIDRLGLSTALRMDSIVFGDPGRPVSQLVHPGRTDYSLGVRLLPSGSWIGLEAHHVSSHAVENLHGSTAVQFEEQIKNGGASNFASLLFEFRGHELRTGFGSVWTDTNTAPILLDHEGILLNSRAARGPFTTLRVPIGNLFGMSGHSSALYVHDSDSSSGHRFEGSYLAWGTSLYRPLDQRWILGLSYVGNNGSPGLKRANNSASAFLKLRWGAK